MFPLVPPPLSDSGAITWPRTLQKWLDINPISALTRVQAYITLPSFNIGGVSWAGYSNIIASFNFEGPSNFSLSGLSQIPVSPNYLAAISWRDNVGNVHRYALWQNVGETFLFPVLLYSNQPIMANFRIEIWSTVNTGTVAIQASPVQLYTTQLGGIDYRWGTDYTLVNADTIVTNFSISLAPSLGLQPVTNPQNGVLGGWLRADTNVSGYEWAVKQNGSTNYFQNGSFDGLANLNLSNIITNSTEPLISSQTDIKGPLPLWQSIVNSMVPNDIWMLIKYLGDGTVCAIYTTSGSSKLKITNGVFNIDGTNVGNTPLQIGQWYILEWWSYPILTLAGGNVNVWQLQSESNTLSPIGYFSAGSVNQRNSSSSFYIGDTSGSASIYITDVLAYSSIMGTYGNAPNSDQATMLAYFQDRYMQAFALPFVWPIGSYSQPNTPAFTLLENNNTTNPNNTIVFGTGPSTGIGTG